MVDRSTIDEKAIIIMDRGYESYDVMVHIQEKGNRKYDYKVNFSVSVHICREFLLNANILPDIEFMNA